MKLQFERVRVAAVHGKPVRMAPAVASLLTPAAAVSGVLSLWRLGADLKWTEQFAISQGFFSHWQVWMAIALALQSGASYLRTHIGE